MKIFTALSFSLCLTILLGVFFFPNIETRYQLREKITQETNHPAAPFLPFSGDIKFYGQGFSSLTRGENFDFDKVETKTLIVKHNDTMASLFKREQIYTDFFPAFLDVLHQHMNTRRIKPKQSFEVTLKKNADKKILNSFHADLSVDKKLVIIFDAQAESFQSFVFTTPLYQKIIAVEGVIASTLFETAFEKNIPRNIVVDMVRLFSFDIDFQRDIKKNSHFKLLYQIELTKDGQLTQNNSILMAEIKTTRQLFAYWYFKPKDQEGDYFNLNGESATTFLMKTPLDASRISSYFGFRRHPVLGYTRLHKGVDFAAPVGSPVFASGDGVISKIKRHNKGYGYHIEIKHAGSYRTLYAHLSRFASGIELNKKVKQSDVIGYVGLTGLTNGSHLHYEVKLSNQAINPFLIKPNRVHVLERKNREKFDKKTQLYQKIYQNSLPPKVKENQSFTFLYWSLEKIRYFLQIKNRPLYKAEIK